MRTPGRMEAALLGTAVLLGLLADVMLRGLPLGLNATVVGAALTAALLAFRLPVDRPWERWAYAAAALSIAAFFCWRDSPVLKALDGLALLVTLGLMASGAHERSSLSSYVLRVGRSSAFVLPGPIPALTSVRWSDVRSPISWRFGVGVARGLLLAAPVVALFTVLLVNADAVFAIRLAEIFDLDLSHLVGHAAAVFALTWLAAGLLWAALHAHRALPLPPRPGWLALGSIEIGVVLALLDLLFAGFVWVQLRYLFGGRHWVEEVAGLTYSQYARRGFFELVAVTALALPLLLAAHWLMGHARTAVRRAVLGLAAFQVALLLVMLASALERMEVYRTQYGQTELRYYSTAFMLWLGALLVSFLLTVLPGARGAFARVVTTSAFAALVLLHAVNPDGRIVAANRDAPQGFDLEYALSLSADAVPALLEAAPALPPEARDALSWQLLARWSAPEPDLRTWSLAREQARRLVAQAQAVAGRAERPRREAAEARLQERSAAAVRRRRRGEGGPSSRKVISSSWVTASGRLGG